MKLCVWRLALGQLYSRDTQAPDIGLVVITALLDDLRGHPVRRADKRIFLRGQRTRQLSRNTKVG